MVTQMLLLRFQMCAVVNHLRHRKSRMPRVANPECRDPSHGRPKSVGVNIAHLHIRRRHHDRPSTRIEMRHRQNAVLLRHRLRKSGMPCVVTITDVRNLSEATSHIHASAGAATIVIQLASKRDIAKAIQGPNSAPGDCFFQIPEHPMLPQQQPVSSNSASYVLSVSCLFLCGPLRRISVNARFYVQCCLVL